MTVVSLSFLLNRFWSEIFLTAFKIFARNCCDRLTINNNFALSGVSIGRALVHSSIGDLCVLDDDLALATFLNDLNPLVLLELFTILEPLNLAVRLVQFAEKGDGVLLGRSLALKHLGELVWILCKMILNLAKIIIC
jgi:hypothetical protein